MTPRVKPGGDGPDEEPHESGYTRQHRQQAQAGVTGKPFRNRKRRNYRAVPMDHVPLDWRDLGDGYKRGGRPTKVADARVAIMLMTDGDDAALASDVRPVVAEYVECSKETVTDAAKRLTNDELIRRERAGNAARVVRRWLDRRSGAA